MNRRPDLEARTLAEAALRWLGVPACAVDFETTGPLPAIDDLVSAAIGRYDPTTDTVDWWSSLFRPSVAVTSGATAAHGLTDADLADAPTLAQRWPYLFDRLDGAVWVGHGIRRFDVPMIAAAFARLPGSPVPPVPAAVVDTLDLMTHFEPRRLAAAVAHYCGRTPTAAHTAEGDAIDAADVLGAMVARYGLDTLGAGDADPWARVAALQALTSTDASPEELADYVEPSGRFVWRGSVAYCTFGSRTKGQRIEDIDAGFWRWLLKQPVAEAGSRDGFPETVRQIASDALRGRYPQRTEAPLSSGQDSRLSSVGFDSPRRYQSPAPEPRGLFDAETEE